MDLRVSVNTVEVTFHEQAEVWLDSLKTRKRKPVSPATLRAFGSYVRRLAPIIGEMKIADINNGVLRNVVQRLDAENLSAKTINELVATVKSVVASLVDPNTGEPILEREWSARFIDCPTITAQKRPRITAKDVQRCIDVARTDQEKLFYAVLGGSGLRVAEAQALHFRGNQDQTSWDPENGAITVRSSIFNGREILRVKTLAGRRTVHLHPLLNDLIARYVEIHGIQSGEHLFQARGGRPMHIGTIRRRLAKHGIPGCHCFRRFFVSHRRSLGFPEPLLRSMIGHSGISITDEYDQSAEDEAYRKDWTRRVGLGFELPEFCLGLPAPQSNSSPKPNVDSAPQANSSPKYRVATVDHTTPSAPRYVATDEDLPLELFQEPTEPLGEVR